MLWTKISSSLIIILGLICFTIGAQEAIAIRKSFLEHSLSKYMGKDVEGDSVIKEVKSFAYYSGIRHSFYGILLILSGIGIILRKFWGKLLFLGFWLLVFFSNIYFVIKGLSFSYILILSLSIFFVSVLIFNKPEVKKEFRTRNKRTQY